MTNLSAKVRLARVADRQFGRVSAAQLKHLEIPKGTVSGWIDQGYLHPELPRVYAVGHSSRTVESELIAAVLYAGPGAMLSHSTAAWWVGLTSSRPHRIDVSTPRRCRSLPGIRVHRERHLERCWHKGLPVTRFEQTMVDYAAQTTLTNVRLALAKADYESPLNVEPFAAVLKPGHHGAARLRLALARHMPALADARSLVEATFMELCEAYHLPLPELNAEIAGWDVDILWRKQLLVIELDGPRNHRTPAQVRRDRRKEMELRGRTVMVLRYSDEQVREQGDTVMQEVRAVYADRDAPSQSDPTGTRTRRRPTRAARRG
jgi:very-short-patch-repair endonuclease